MKIDGKSTPRRSGPLSNPIIRPTCVSVLGGLDSYLGAFGSADQSSDFTIRVAQHKSVIFESYVWKSRQIDEDSEREGCAYAQSAGKWLHGICVHG